jgi:virulence-associated protein VagC
VVTVKVFRLGKAQAVRIPARYRLAVQEVEVFERAGELVLRPKRRTAADVFAAARAIADGVPLERPAQGELRPVSPLGS